MDQQEIDELTAELVRNRLEGVEAPKDDIAYLLGKTLVVAEADDDTVTFVTTSGEILNLFHEQDCCESVYVESIDGNLDDLVGEPILQAEEVHNANAAGLGGDESFTWTFYKLATRKGYVTIRFYGSSNGYYSESVTFGPM